MGLYSGGLIMRRILSPEIWGAFFWVGGGGGGRRRYYWNLWYLLKIAI